LDFLSRGRSELCRRRSLPVLPELEGLDSDRGGLAGRRARHAARDSSPRLPETSVT
jgi:hypothetical protein